MWNRYPALAFVLQVLDRRESRRASSDSSSSKLQLCTPLNVPRRLRAPMPRVPIMKSALLPPHLCLEPGRPRRICAPCPYPQAECVPCVAVPSARLQRVRPSRAQTGSLQTR